MSVCNNVTIVGRIAREINVSDAGGTSIAKTSVAVDRDYKNKEGKYDTDFIPISAIGKSAEFLDKYFSKGDAIAVTGSIRTGSYTNKDGQKVYTTDVAVDKISFVPSAKKSETTEETSAKKTASKPKKEDAKVDADDDFMNLDPEADDLPW